MALHDEPCRRSAEPENGHMRTTNKVQPVTYHICDPAIIGGSVNYGAKVFRLAKFAAQAYFAVCDTQYCLNQDLMKNRDTRPLY